MHRSYGRVAVFCRPRASLGSEQEGRAVGVYGGLMGLEILKFIRIWKEEVKAGTESLSLPV